MVVGGPRSVLVGLVVVTLLASACGRMDTPGNRGETASGQQRSQGPKTLTIAVQAEPAVLIDNLAQTNVRGGGANVNFNIVHNFLVVQDYTQTYRPQIATEMPSIDKGTWRLNADGGMDLTWKIHPNVKWHDGTPFTTDDLVFSFNVYKDKEIPNAIGRIMDDFASVTAVDAHTLVAHWSRHYVDADQAPALAALPKHLFADLYATSKADIPSSPRLSTAFVGLGPYKVVRWESGSFIEYGRFDDYFKGRPPLDSVIVRIFPDHNTMVAAILSGAIDLIPAIGLDVDASSEVKRRWEGTANQAIPQLRGGIRALEMQFRPDHARPINGLTSLSVRQGLYHAIDRASLAETLNRGLGFVADSWFSPTDAIRPQVESSIPQFPYDPARAASLLSTAGWTRGADGLLVNQQGERFELQLTARGLRDAKEQLIIADNWKAVGAQLDLYDMPPALQADREVTSTLPGAWLATIQIYHFITDRFHTKTITSPANRWTGTNRGGYSNPRVDTLLEKLTATIPPGERIAIYRDLLQQEMGDLPTMVLYWEGDIVLAQKGIMGIENARGGGDGTWNFAEWDKE